MRFYKLLCTLLVSVLLCYSFILFISKPETAFSLEYFFFSLKLTLKMHLLLKLLNGSSFLTLFIFCSFCGPVFSPFLLTTYICTKAKIINLINKVNSMEIIPLLPSLECICIQFLVRIRNPYLPTVLWFALQSSLGAHEVDSFQVKLKPEKKYRWRDTLLMVVQCKGSASPEHAWCELRLVGTEFHFANVLLGASAFAA